MSTFDELNELVRGFEQGNTAIKQMLTPLTSHERQATPPPDPQAGVRELPLNIIPPPYHTPSIQQHSPSSQMPLPPQPPVATPPPQQVQAPIPQAHPMATSYAQAQGATSLNPMHAFGPRQGFPDPQYLTPPSAGVYRDPYDGPPQFGTVQRPPSLVRSIGVERGMIPSNTWETPFDQRIDASRDRVSSEIALASGTGRFLAEAVGGGIGSVAGAALTPFAPLLGGLGGGAAGFAVGGAAYDAVTDPFMAQYRRGREMSMASRGTVTTGNLARAGGDGMTTRAGLDLTRELDTHAADDSMFNRADMDKITQLGFQKGLIGNAGDVETMAQGVKNISDQVKLVMKIAGDPDIQSVMDQMSQLSRFGIQTTEMADTFMHLKGAARTTGKTINELMHTSGAQGGHIYNQMGLSTGRGFVRGIEAEENVRHSMNAGLFTSGQWSQMGDASGAAQRQTQAFAAGEKFMHQLLPTVMGVDEDGGLMIDQRKVDQLLETGDFEAALRDTSPFEDRPGEEAGAGRRRMRHFSQNQGAWNDTLMSNMNPEDAQLLFQRKILSMARQFMDDSSAPVTQEALNLTFASLGMDEPTRNAMMAQYDQETLRQQDEARKLTRSEDFMTRREQAELDNRWRNRTASAVSHGFNDVREGLFGDVGRWWADREQRLEEEAVGTIRRGAAYDGPVEDRDLERMYGDADPSVTMRGTGRIEEDDPEAFKRFLGSVGVRRMGGTAANFRSNADTLRGAQEMSLDESTSVLREHGLSSHDVTRQRQQLARTLSRNPAADLSGWEGLQNQEVRTALMAQSLEFEKEDGSMFASNIEVLDRFSDLDEGHYVASTEKELESRMQEAAHSVRENVWMDVKTDHSQESVDIMRSLAGLTDDEKAYVLTSRGLTDSNMFKQLEGRSSVEDGKTRRASKVAEQLEGVSGSRLKRVAAGDVAGLKNISRVEGDKLASDLLRHFEVGTMEDLRGELNVGEGEGMRGVLSAAEGRGFEPGSGWSHNLLAGDKDDDKSIADEVEPFARAADVFKTGTEEFSHAVKVFSGSVGAGNGQSSGGGVIPSGRRNAKDNVPTELGQ